MKRLTTILVAAMFLVVLGVGSTMAYPLNTRPVTVEDSGEQTLQEIFNDLYVSGPGIDAYNDQIEDAYFMSDSSGGAVATFIIEVAGNAGSNVFGIYEAGDISNTALIFSGADGTGEQKLVSFMENGDIKVNGVVVASDFTGAFGFYLGFGETVFYSDDSLNPDGNAQALIYRGDDVTQLNLPGYTAGVFTDDEYIVAWEDIAYANSDKDFNDGVFMIESISPVPEPATMLLLGLGLLGFGFVRRKS